METPTTELLMKIRNWNRDWDDWHRGLDIPQPLGIGNFADYLDTKFKIEKND